MEGLQTYTEGIFTVADVLSDSDLARYTRPISEKADKVIAMIDACHSGGVINNSTRSVLGPNLHLRAKFNDFSNQSCAVAVNNKRNLLSEVKRLPNENTDRPAVYCEVGLWISHHAQWLIALWDGQETNAAPGGTAWVVEVFRQRHKGHRISLPDAGHVAHIMVQRSALI